MRADRHDSGKTGDRSVCQQNTIKTEPEERFGLKKGRQASPDKKIVVNLYKEYTSLKSRELEELPRFQVMSWQPF